MSLLLRLAGTPDEVVASASTVFVKGPVIQRSATRAAALLVIGAASQTPDPAAGTLNNVVFVPPPAPFTSRLTREEWLIVDYPVAQVDAPLRRSPITFSAAVAPQERARPPWLLTLDVQVFIAPLDQQRFPRPSFWAAPVFQREPGSARWLLDNYFVAGAELEPAILNAARSARISSSIERITSTVYAYAIGDDVPNPPVANDPPPRALRPQFPPPPDAQVRGAFDLRQQFVMDFTGPQLEPLLIQAGLKASHFDPPFTQISPLDSTILRVGADVANAEFEWTVAQRMARVPVFTPVVSQFEPIVSPVWQIQLAPFATELEAAVLAQARAGQIFTRIDTRVSVVSLAIGADVPNPVVGDEAAVTSMVRRTWDFPPEPVTMSQKAFDGRYHIGGAPDHEVTRGKDTMLYAPFIPEVAAVGNDSRALLAMQFDTAPGTPIELTTLAGGLRSTDVVVAPVLFEGRRLKIMLSADVPNPPDAVDPFVITSRNRQSKWFEVPERPAPKAIRQQVLVLTAPDSEYIRKASRVDVVAPAAFFRKAPFALTLLGAPVFTPDAPLFTTKRPVFSPAPPLFPKARDYRVTQLDLATPAPPGQFQFHTRREKFPFAPAQQIQRAFGDWLLVLKRGREPHYRRLFDVGRLELVELDLLPYLTQVIRYTVSELAGNDIGSAGRLELIELPEYE